MDLYKILEIRQKIIYHKNFNLLHMMIYISDYHRTKKK